MEASTYSEPASTPALNDGGSGPAPVEMRLGPAARALAHSLADGRDNGPLAQMLADIFPCATTIRLGLRTHGGILLLSSCLLVENGIYTKFFAVPNCPSALQECLDSSLCGYYLRSDAHKPDLQILWRDAPRTMAALCGAIPSLGHLPGALGCRAALFVGIRRGDNSLVSAGLSSLAAAFAQHLPEVLAQVSKAENAYPPIPDPGSALHQLLPPSSSSQTPTSSSCQSSDNTCSGGQASLAGPPAKAPRQSGSPSPTTRSSSSGRSSGSLGHQLPVCPEGVSIQEDSELWDPAREASEQASEETSPMAARHVSSKDLSASPGTGSGSALRCDNATRGDEWGALASSATASSPGDSCELLAITEADDSRPVPMGSSFPSTSSRPPAWEDDLQSKPKQALPKAVQPESIAPAGFALFDSASSHPGTCNGPPSKGNNSKTEQALAQTVMMSDSPQRVTQAVETSAALSSSIDKSGVPATIVEAMMHDTWQQDARPDCDWDTAEESGTGTDAPGAAPAKSGAAARRARASRARAWARAQALRERAAQAEQPQESTSTGSYWQRAVPERRRGGNSSDSDSALAGGSTPYRRRSPQHPFWLTFLDPALEAAFVAWQAQQQFAGDVLSALLIIFVLLIQLAHPSLKGPAFTLHACIAAMAAGALCMIIMQRERWQKSRELLSSCLHGVISGAILLFVFPAWARSLPGSKLRSLMWLFRFSGSEGGCVVPFICMLRFRQALWNQALLLLASVAVSLPAVCGLPDAIKPPRLCFGLGMAMEAAAFVLPLAAVHLLERRARSSFLLSPAALLPHAD